MDEALASFFWIPSTASAGDDGHDAGGDGALKNHHKPHDVAAEAEGIHDGDAGCTIGHASGKDEVHGVDHEAEDLFEKGPDREAEDLAA